VWLTLWGVGVLGGALLALGVAVRVTVRAYLTSGVDSELASRAATSERIFFQKAGFIPPLEPVPPLAVAVAGAFRAAEAPATPLPEPDASDINLPRVFTLDGKPLSLRPERGGATPWDRAALAEAAASGRPLYSTRHVGGEPLRLLTSPLHDTQGRTGALIQIAFRLTDIERGLAAVDLTLLTLLPLALVVTVSGGTLLTNRAIRPIERALEQERRFVADASHELRTPVAIIAAAAELGLEAEPGDAAAPRRALERIAGASARTRRIVEDLLLLARAGGEGGAHTLSPEPVPALALLTDAAALFEPLRDGRTFRIDAAPADLCVLADRHHLGRALSNLLDNAVRHTAAGAGVITLAARPDGPGRVALSVSDDGEGVPAVELPRLFDRFYRADASRARRTGGAGLGLSIVRAVAEAHGGTAAVESTPGAGTRVTLILPAPK
jgi:signal transduction histidine kinase